MEFTNWVPDSRALEPNGDRASSRLMRQRMHMDSPGGQIQVTNTYSEPVVWLDHIPKAPVQTPFAFLRNTLQTSLGDVSSRLGMGHIDVLSGEYADVICTVTRDIALMITGHLEGSESSNLRDTGLNHVVASDNVSVVFKVRKDSVRRDHLYLEFRFLFADTVAVPIVKVGLRRVFRIAEDCNAEATRLLLLAIVRVRLNRILFKNLDRIKAHLWRPAGPLAVGFRNQVS